MAVSKQTHRWPNGRTRVGRWHLDEMYVRLNGEMVNFWRAVDHEGETLESFVKKKRDSTVALVFMKKALKRHGSAETIVTDGPRSCPATMREPGNLERRLIDRQTYKTRHSAALAEWQTLRA